MALVLYNTLTRTKEAFVPIEEGRVKMYNCGPTVYDFAHIGNLRSYVFADILKRTLAANGYEVEQIVNITDIGHLSSDADSGEDKMMKALLREGKPMTLLAMREVADFYFKKYLEDRSALNILPAQEFPFASDHVAEDIAMVENLTAKGFTYKTSDGIYFDTSNVPDYGKLSGGASETENLESRIGENSEKKNPRDFAVWKFSKDEGLGYDAPFGVGFPGWHIECSALILKFLGKTIDIHTGGIDHIAVHHTNEIAQSESANGAPLAHFWLHNEFITVRTTTENEKMAKSGGNFITLNTVREHNIDPIAYRFWLLMGHYRSQLHFNWDALAGTHSAQKRLYALARGLDGAPAAEADKDSMEKFMNFMNDDLDTPRALTVLWYVVKDETMSAGVRKATIIEMDKILGLGLDNPPAISIPENIISIADLRLKARAEKNFEESDRLRDEALAQGYIISDTESGYSIEPK